MADQTAVSLLIGNFGIVLCFLPFAFYPWLINGKVENYEFYQSDFGRNGTADGSNKTTIGRGKADGR
jgi:hypothetical protein